LDSLGWAITPRVAGSVTGEQLEHTVDHYTLSSGMIVMCFIHDLQSQWKLAGRNMRKKPLIIGHRGSSGSAPENTLISFRQSIEDGADGIEFDVRLSSDHVPVVIHDDNLKRTSLREGVIALLTSEEIQRCNAGSWFNKKNPSKASDLFETECIPTLEATLSLISSKPDFRLYLEMKCEQDDTLPLVEKVTEQILSNGLKSQVVVESFNHKSIKEIKKIDPEIQTAALFDRSLSNLASSSERILNQARACEADELALHYSLVSEKLINEARAAGFGTVVWTVDTENWVDKAVELSIDAVITNEPALMRKSLISKYG
jgi:glycerophosphoryl diester phosphodiesterase